MDWITTFHRFRAAWTSGRSLPMGETGINGVPHDANAHTPIGLATRQAPVDPADARTAEDIKRRQIALALRYVVAVRSLSSTETSGRRRD